MKISQIIFLGMALFLTVEFTAGSHLANCGLGSGVNPCGCSEVIVRAAKQQRPVKYADPYVIREAAAARHAPAPSVGCGSLNQPRVSTGLTVVDLLKPSCGPVAPRFRPIGDLCSSHNSNYNCKPRITEVTPAYPGRPSCSCGKHQTPVCECNEQPSASSSCVYQSSNPELAAFEDEGLSFDEQESIYNGQCLPAAPADPVSLSLAFGLGLSRQATQTRNTIYEGALPFGPNRTPIDGSVQKKAVNIPEEKLFTVERPVVELKSAPKASTSFSATYQDIIAQQEALEQQRIDLEAAQESQQQASSYISYKDLGYGLVDPKTPKFISTVSSGSSGSGGSQTVQTVDESACGPLGPTVPGYVSGNVIVRSDPNEDNDGDYNSYGDEGSFELDPYSSYSSEESEPCNGNGGGILARLRASAHAQSRSGRGYGCGCGH